MKDAHARARESKRHSGESLTDVEKVPTYQELLDEALDETFPASDPISPTAAMHASHRIESERDAVDWALKPGGNVASGAVTCRGDAGLLTEALAQEAIDRVLPMLQAAIEDREVCGTGALALIVLAPRDAQAPKCFEECVLVEQGLGDREAWDADYAGFARAKARLAWESGESSRTAQAKPHLLRAGHTLLTGGVNLDGIVVGVSGAHAWYDEAFATAIAAMLRSLALREHDRLRSAGTCFVPSAPSAGPS